MVAGGRGDHAPCGRNARVAIAVAQRRSGRATAARRGLRVDRGGLGRRSERRKCRASCLAHMAGAGARRRWRRRGLGVSRGPGRRASLRIHRCLLALNVTSGCVVGAGVLTALVASSCGPGLAALASAAGAVWGAVIIVYRIVQVAGMGAVGLAGRGSRGLHWVPGSLGHPARACGDTTENLADCETHALSSTDRCVELMITVATTPVRAERRRTLGLRPSSVTPQACSTQAE